MQEVLSGLRFAVRLVALIQSEWFSWSWENSIYLIYHELIRSFQGIDYVPVIADIQDYDRLLQVFEQYQPAIVYHAAAHKHVPMMERNPKEAFKNNILGTYNVAKAVDAAKVPKMVMISTDKAVNPPNVMGLPNVWQS